MNKILITGCNGQLGRALNEQLKYETDIVILNTDIMVDENLPNIDSKEMITWSKLDITSEEEVLNIVMNFRPNIIINAAAHTAVDLCEKEEDKAYQINAIGPKNLASAAKAVDSKIIQVSTDYVFDGTSKEPYIETDKVNPVSAYGRTKLAGEEFVKNNSCKYFIIRTAWLYGDGNNFVKTMLRLAKDHNEISVVGDQYGTPTSAKELAKMILILMYSDLYGTYHGTCEGSTSWYEFACEIFKLAKLKTKVIKVTTKEYNSETARPEYSVLENKKLKENFDFRMKDWEEALEDYM